MSKQEIKWIDLDIKDRSTWPKLNIEKVLIVAASAISGLTSPP